MKLRVIAVASALVAAAAVYLVLIRDGAPNEPPDALAAARSGCGNVDLLKGDVAAGAKVAACLELAGLLMGRPAGQTNLATVDDAAARALLKRLCDQASEAACTQLLDFDDTKLDIATDRCSYAKPADPRACIDVGRSWSEGRTYREGRRVRPMNVHEARKWYALACDLGDAEGCRRKTER